jgi:hypothetical protein
LATARSQVGLKASTGWTNIGVNSASDQCPR